jgi:DNA-directed RNA polymerase III subunit RPC1
LADCAGHFGYVRLALPVFHIGFFRATIQVLQDVCKECSRILLSDEDRALYLRRLRAPRLDSLQRQGVLKGIHDRARKNLTCPHCQATNGFVRKVGVLKIVHEKYNKATKKTQEEIEDFRNSFQEAIESNPDIKQHVTKAQEDLNPLKVQDILSRIPSEDCELLGLDPMNGGRPELFLWTHIPVPPACIRPSVAMTLEGGSNEDDLTIKLSEIVYTNFIIKDALEKGATVQMLMEDWDFLQLQCAMYINSELPGVPLALQNPGKPIRGLCQRLKGKMGRFRGNLSGKRVDFSARTVISPDPNLRIDQVAVPVHVARVMTYPETVTRFNIERLRVYVLNGPDQHPGANFVQNGQGGMKRFLRFGDRKKIAKELRFGDIIERHLIDGDVVLFNRQPSLHKLSIMAHFAVVKPWRTFRFNECACTPYNADFDGDEMNLHLPQTEEARAEAMELMGLQHNLVTPRNGNPLVAAMQDFITASYVLTQKDVFLDRGEFCQLLVGLSDGQVNFELPHPSILRPTALWSGKQVISSLLRPKAQSNASFKRINLEGKTKTYSGRGLDMCHMDGWLLVREGHLLMGTLDKSSVGGDSKASIFYVLLRELGSAYTIDCMTRLSKLCARFLGSRGFSIGIDDVTPGPRLRKRKEDLVRAGYAECDQNIAAFCRGELALQPGCSAEETLESSISGILSRIRDDCGQLCIQELSRFNAPLMMQWCGSKGSRINVSQMVACVGQQIIAGSRIPDGFHGRSLPHFPHGSKTPAAKGFVQNSFYSGLSPTEFFFHAVSGREGLVDTAVKTAETGYMQRRLMKALEDLSTQYDGSVRNSTGGIVQFVYGDDGLDPALMEGDGGDPLNLARLLLSVRNGNDLTVMQDETFDMNVCAERTAPASWNGAFRALVLDFISKHGTGVFRNASQVDQFMALIASKYERLRVEPGTAVGALAGQSIGEPGTQMTLKTFHFAGVASMNVTLGVPRIKEIINAAKNISTPIITAELVNPGSLPSARIVKGRLEKTLLGDVATHIDEVVSPGGGVFLRIELDLAAIRALQLSDTLTPEEIRTTLLKTPKLMKMAGAAAQILIVQPATLLIQLGLNENYSSSSSANNSKSLTFAMQQLRRALPLVVVAGISSVGRAVINDLGSSAGTTKSFNLLVEGSGLRQVLTTEGIVGTTATSNHITEIEQVLGIEAARSTIAHEITFTMSKHGMTIDPRHVALLADVMTYRGQVLGITRFGIAKMKDSVLMLASFEKTTDHLFDAARFAKQDDIDGVSECIIMGSPMPVGTGLFKVISNNSYNNNTNSAKSHNNHHKLLFDRPEFHPKWINSQ